MLPRNQAGQIFRLLLRASPAADLVDAQVGMRTVGQSKRGTGAAHFLARDHMFEIAEPEPAPFLFHRDAVQAERAHFRPKIAREPVFVVHPLRERRNPVGRETRGRLTDHIRRFTQAKIEFHYPLLRVRMRSITQSRPQQNLKQNFAPG